MKKYVSDAVTRLQGSDENTIEVKLKNKNDYKRNFISLMYNRFIFLIQQKIVPSHVKNLILRTTGMKVGNDACIPHDIKIDPYFPELIRFRKGCLIGGCCEVKTHEIDGKTLKIGKVELKERTMCGGMVRLNPGAILNKNSIINFYSVVSSEVPEGELWGGEPAEKMTSLDEKMKHKFFRPPDGNYKSYYKLFNKKVKAFLDDPDQTYLKIYYNGKRQNAGNDWWRSRNVLRIWWNGLLMEASRFLPPNIYLRNILFKMCGVKLGKNVKIGKNVVIDHIYCDTVKVGNNCILEDNVYIDGHEYTITQTVFGKVNIGDDVRIGKDSYVRTATTISDGIEVKEKSFCQREMTEGKVWAGNPAKKIE